MGKEARGKLASDCLPVKFVFFKQQSNYAIPLCLRIATVLHLLNKGVSSCFALDGKGKERVACAYRLYFVFLFTALWVCFTSSSVKDVRQEKRGTCAISSHHHVCIIHRIVL